MLTYGFIPSHKGDKKMKHFLITFALITMMIFPAGQSTFAGQAKTNTASLVIHITGFDNTDGQAKVALVNSQKNYESDGAPYMGFNFKIINNEVLQTVNVPKGEYAVKVYHDENTNDEMDTLMFGIPSEKYGFSNNARGTFGPPAFGDAKFKVESAEHKISIKIE